VSSSNDINIWISWYNDRTKGDFLCDAKLKQPWTVTATWCCCTSREISDRSHCHEWVNVCQLESLRDTMEHNIMKAYFRHDIFIISIVSIATPPVYIVKTYIVLFLSYWASNNQLTQLTRSPAIYTATVGVALLAFACIAVASPNLVLTSYVVYLQATANTTKLLKQSCHLMWLFHIMLLHGYRDVPNNFGLWVTEGQNGNRRPSTKYNCFIYLFIYLSIYLSIYLYVYLFI